MLHGGALQWRSMLTILAITSPFFALVLCGYLAVRRSLLPLAAIGGLNSFVLYFALPCMLYRFGAATPSPNCSTPACSASTCYAR